VSYGKGIGDGSSTITKGPIKKHAVGSKPTTTKQQPQDHQVGKEPPMNKKPFNFNGKLNAEGNFRTSFRHLTLVGTCAVALVVGTQNIPHP